MNSEKLLIVEDADSLREVLCTVLESEGYRCVAFSRAESALEEIKKGDLACILADFRLPGMSGLEFLAKVREFSPHIPFLMMTAYGSIDLAVDAMRQGANDFIQKPFEPERMCSAVHDMIEHRRIIDRSAGLRTRRERSFLTVHPGMQKILQQAAKVAAVDSSVLILGESGTGKELLARYIHDHSPRADKPFVAINCAAMPADLLESEFFGHEAGAFTGATQTRVGIFEHATEGTIFLDEIGEMPLTLQVKLLRALQEREIKRVGGSRSIKVNPRVIAATNHDVEEVLQNGRMRDDLYYRIAVVTFEIPALRHRPCDIKLLTSFFLDYFSSQLGKSLTLDETATMLLQEYRWPGNGRELENVIERAVILAESVIKAEHLGIHLALDLAAIEDSSHTLTEIATLAARNAEISLIKRTLDRTLGNKSKAAQLLGVSYKTLLNKVKEYHLGDLQTAEQ